MRRKCNGCTSGNPARKRGSIPPLRSKYKIMKYKVQITKLDSKGKERIVDVKICDTRDEYESFIKKCKAIPKQYKPNTKFSDCFYELSA